MLTGSEAGAARGSASDAEPNRSDRSVMLERELLDYEAIFRDIDDRAAEDLLRTLRDALNRIMEDPDEPVDV